MWPFAKPIQSHLGVDLGTGGIKMVELLGEKGRGKLLTYSFTERLPESHAAQALETPKETAELLKKMVAKAKVATRSVVAALPASVVWSVVVNIPQVSDRERKQLIELQARKFIPVPLEELSLDYKVIPPAEGVDKDKTSKTTQVLLTGARKSLVQQYAALFTQAGLTLSSLETESFALVRSLIGKDRATTMIVDIGAMVTSMLIVDAGVPIVSRNLDIGGAMLTKALAKQTNTEVAVAERMKLDLGNGGVESLPAVFNQVLSPLINELRYSINLFLKPQDSSPAKQIEKIILTGGSALLPSFVDYIRHELGIKTYIGDPWARVMYPEDLRPTLDTIGPRFSVAIGLAMRDID
jgi:type IV pilus assembly protein PilM